jgi:hypothetical protein
MYERAKMHFTFTDVPLRYYGDQHVSAAVWFLWEQECNYKQVVSESRHSIKIYIISG